ncbi:MAG: ABC transporter ATP-binding protein [Betaproteobacteria bacterium]|nr:ABC transporter ATP-binding protein [Betaproteobacteria bacterium]
MKLEVRELRKSYGAFAALRGVSFEVRSGERVAMIGPNGAGKSTCFNVVNGQLRPDAGTVRLDDIDVSGRAPRHLARLGIGRTFQTAETFASMSVRENVQLALLSHRGRCGSLVANARCAFVAEAQALLERVGLAAQADRASASLAYADLKRLELALALAGEPKLLLMDEPTAGMAPQERSELMRLVVELAERDSTAVLFTEHDMDVVFGFATRVLVLHAGALIASGTPEAVRADPRVREVYLGSA